MKACKAKDLVASMITRSREQRGLETLLPQEGPMPEDWLFSMGRHFNDALDIRYQKRVTNKKERMVWTQGSAFNFPVGYTVDSTDGCIRIQVLKSRPVDPTASSVKTGFAAAFLPVHEGLDNVFRDPGHALCAVYAKDMRNDFPYKLIGSIDLTQDELVLLLIKGHDKLSQLLKEQGGRPETPLHSAAPL